jgi:hypothetical protein
MSAIIDAIEDFLSEIWEAFKHAVRQVWDSIVEPILEPIFGLFGIEDETIVDVLRVSSKLFGQNAEDTVKAATIRAILAKIAHNTGFFANYMSEIYRVKGQMRAYYNYAARGIYVNGLPDMRITGANANFNAIQAALDDYTGSTNTVLSAVSQHPTSETYFKYDLQTSHSYHPWDNTLTAVDTYGATWSDWQMGDVTYNSGPNNHSIAISRTAVEAKFWIEGPSQITEGDTAIYTIKCNRTVPAGESVDINFSYGGTAVDPTDYTQDASVTMVSETNEVTVSLPTLETGNSNRTIIITISSITNTNAAFEMVTVHTLSSVTTTITDDDTLRLNTADVLVDEANTTITIPVTLSQVAPSGAFSVGYNFTDLGSITGGVDYDNTTGTLNFAGTAGEIQNISVDIYADVADDDREQFEVYFENLVSSDSIDITVKSTVTILDGTSDPAAGTGTLNDTITKPAYIDEHSLVVTYENDSDPEGQWWYWIYKHSEGTYEVDFDVSEISNMEMLPVAILRKDHTNITGAELISCKNLIRHLAYEVDDFIEAIDTNPDIDLIDDAYVNFSVNPLDSNKVVSKLLYLMWEVIVEHEALVSDVDQYKATFEEGDVNNAVVWTKHTRTEDISGVKTAVGEYIHDVPSPPPEGGKHEEGGSDLTMYYQKTASTYDQIKVEHLNGLTAINYQTHHQIALNVLGQDNFTFPVSRFVFEELTAKEQLEVFQYLFRIDFYAISITELEWYETEAFWDLFNFVLIVVTIWFLPWGGNLWDVGYAIIKQYVINYAVAELMIWVAKATGNEELAALFGLLMAIRLGGFKGLNAETFLSAEQLLNLATNYAQNLMVVEGELAIELAEEMQTSIDEAQAELDKEKANRDDLDTVKLDSNFIAYLQSVDTSYFPAIHGQYQYDELYNYDSILSDYFDQQLLVGVN